ncbi:hypothetical protein LOD44_09975 [Xylella fastidiosa subsp. multiplex]|uniref:Uncharacterized protein n=3 Tax=Xylella fastidiosa TaxID=2371 RepID=A0A9Q4QRZ3_XYLFS|nr:hypothetical protein [Xylella fastidiosa]KAJ4853376.1 hypothetical protein XYFPCFBP8418_003775 [Xylella fastidiosa subsp. multiplex]MBE0269695.1 hypothetical protein [Xylella fastidiosa subsp. multiplex]MBE0275224.1 hypothetical protein [Xylella fastidiosa subsp. multiplex]MBE0278509.1 hypothetical protein [Xylella fastidiosa subsp. multiplex]MBE0282904.1 hypothetical protein [Xylella fastidiosa subsp. multiplex]
MLPPRLTPLRLLTVDLHSPLHAKVRGDVFPASWLGRTAGVRAHLRQRLDVRPPLRPWLITERFDGRTQTPRHTHGPPRNSNTPCLHRDASASTRIRSRAANAAAPLTPGSLEYKASSAARNPAHCRGVIVTLP